MRTHRTAAQQAGFSLVELMVALVLGLILTSGVISVYITSKNTYNVNNALGAVQEHGRFSLMFMDPNVRMAGYWGCKKQAPFDNPATGDAVTTFAQAVQGYDANGTGVGGSLDLNANPSYETTPPVDPTLWTPDLSTSSTVLYTYIKNIALRGSDIFMVHFMLPNPASLVGPTYDNDTDTLFVSDSSAFGVGGYGIVNACHPTAQPQAFHVASVAAGSVGYDALNSHFDTIATGGINPAVTYVYFVGKGADNGPALYQGMLDSSGNFAVHELVSGIENMQVLYGVNVDGDSENIPDNFQSADTVTDWTKVVCVRVALLARSDDNSVDKAPATAQVFFMQASDSAADANGDAMSLTVPIDRRLRRYFLQTYALRNALP